MPNNFGFTPDNSTSTAVMPTTNTVAPAMPDPNTNDQKSVSDFLKHHLFQSVGHAIGNLAAPILHPGKTIEGIGNLISGMFAPGHAGGDLSADQSTPASVPQSGPFQTYQSFGQNFLGGALAGNPKGALDKAYNDPAGFLLDIAALTGGSKISEEINPVTKITKGTGTVVDKAGGIAEAPFKGSVNQEALNAAEKLGIDKNSLPLSTQTKSKFLHSTEAIASRMIGGAAVRNSVETARGNVNDFLVNTVQKLTPETLDNQTLGNIIKSGFDDFQNKFETDKNSLYEGFNSRVKDAPAFTKNTAQALKNIIDQEGSSLAPNSNTKYFQTILDKISGAPEVTIRGQQIPDEMAQKLDLNPEHTFENLKQTRTDVGQLLKNNVDPFAVGNRARLQQLYSALSNDMDSTVETLAPKGSMTIKDLGITPEIAEKIGLDPNGSFGYGDLLHHINSFYSTGINKINSKVGSLLENSTPEKIVSNFLKPNNVTNLQSLKAITNPDVMAQVGASFLKTTIDKAMDPDGNFNIQKFQTALSKYDQATMNELLTPEQGHALATALENLKTTKTLQQALSAGIKTAEGSQTAMNQNTLNTLTRLLPQLGPAGVALYIHNIPLAISSILGEWVAPKLLESTWGKRYLTTGYNTNLGKWIQKYAPQIGQGAQAVNIINEGQGQQIQPANGQVQNQANVSNENFGFQPTQ